MLYPIAAVMCIVTLGGDCTKETVDLGEEEAHHLPLMPPSLMTLAHRDPEGKYIYVVDASRRYLVRIDVASAWTQTLRIPERSKVLSKDHDSMIVRHFPARTGNIVSEITWWNGDGSEAILRTVIRKRKANPVSCHWLGKDMVLLCGADGTVRNKAIGPALLYRCSGGLATMPMVVQPIEGEHEIDCVCNLGQGRVILVVSEVGEGGPDKDAVAVLLDAPTGNILAKQRIDAVNEYRFILEKSQNGEFFLVWPAVEDDGDALTVEVRRTDTLELVFRARVGNAPVEDIVPAAVSDDGRFVATGYDKVVVYDATTQKHHTLWDVVDEVDWIESEKGTAAWTKQYMTVCQRWERSRWDLKMVKKYAFRPIAVLFEGETRVLESEHLVVITGDAEIRWWETGTWKSPTLRPRSTLLSNPGLLGPGNSDLLQHIGRRFPDS